MNLGRASLNIALGLTALVLALSFASAQQMKCDVGPVEKTFGSTPWLVYSCDDGASVVVVSATGNPATPFYFVLHPRDGRYSLEGEGTGNKEITDRVAAELQRLSGSEIAALIASTRNIKSSGKPQ